MRQCIMSENRFDFLRELVKNVPDINVAEEQQHNPSGASTSTAAAATIAVAATVDSDDDIEFVSGNSTPTATVSAGAAIGPSYIAASTSSYSPISSIATTASNGLKRTAPSEPINYSVPSYASAYIGGSQHHTVAAAMLPPPPPLLRSVPIAANYYTEIDSSNASGEDGSQSVNSAPLSQNVDDAPHANAMQLHRSVSTPAAATNNSVNSSQSNIASVQPPIINFDFSMGLPNAMSIQYTTPVVTTSASAVQPLVKIDLSNITPAVIPQLSATGSNSINSSADVVAVAKPRRGRPPKIRSVPLPFGAAGQPLSAPPQTNACSPFTPTSMSRPHARGVTNVTDESGISSSGGNKATAHKYQKSARTTTPSQLHHRRRSASSAGNGGTSAAAMASVVPSPALPMPMVGPLAGPTGSSSSCLDMDEDYDNI